jgi:hypothetical protein
LGVWYESPVSSASSPTWLKSNVLVRVAVLFVNLFQVHQVLAEFNSFQLSGGLGSWGSACQGLLLVLCMAFATEHICSGCPSLLEVVTCLGQAHPG